MELVYKAMHKNKVLDNSEFPAFLKVIVEAYIQKFGSQLRERRIPLTVEYHTNKAKSRWGYHWFIHNRVVVYRSTDRQAALTLIHELGHHYLQNLSTKMQVVSDEVFCDAFCAYFGYRLKDETEMSYTQVYRKRRSVARPYHKRTYWRMVTEAMDKIESELVRGQPIVLEEVQETESISMAAVAKTTDEKIKGTYKLNNKIAARITVDGKAIHLGTFETEDEAGHYYDVACYTLGRGLNAYNNPDVPVMRGEFQRVAAILINKEAISDEQYKRLEGLTWQ